MRLLSAGQDRLEAVSIGVSSQPLSELWQSVATSGPFQDYLKHAVWTLLLTLIPVTSYRRSTTLVRLLTRVTMQNSFDAWIARLLDIAGADIAQKVRVPTGSNESDITGIKKTTSVAESILPSHGHYAAYRQLFYDRSTLRPSASPRGAPEIAVQVPTQ